jgi:hypothetical protein
LKKIIITSVLFYSMAGYAQSVSLLNKPLNDAIRRAQLWGDVPIASSFCVRPVDAVKALGFDDPYDLDSKYDFVNNDKTKESLLPKLSIPISGLTDNISDSLTKFIVNKVSPKNLFSLRATPITTRVQYNSHHDYGWQDGPMIPNKGMQYYLNVGVYGKVGPLEFQYAPEIVYASNDSVPPPGVRNIANSGPYDNPDRFGTDPYRRNYLGQSYVKLNLGSVSFGISSENIFWGPGRYSGIVMTENAPGMNHLTIESNNPIKTKIGTFEFNLIGGEKKYSGFTYLTQREVSASDTVNGLLSLPEVMRDTSLDNNFNVFAGAVGVFSPVFLPGFSIGLTREVWTNSQPEEVNYTDYFTLFFSNPFRSAGGGTQSVDQMASVFFRYVMPESHSEVYGEYGFDDNRFDLEDLLVSPEHSRAYMFGFHKIHPIKTKNEYLEFTAEVTHIESSKETYNRIQFGNPVFYDSDYFHRGQNIGAGIGTGSNQWIFSLDHSSEKRRIGFVFERVVRNNDNLYRGQVPWVNTWYGFDFTKKYTEVSLGLNYQKNIGPAIFWTKALLTQTYNWNHWYDPAGTSSVMRANGYNLKSLNIFTGLTLML